MPKNGVKHVKSALPQGVRVQNPQTENVSKTRQIRQMPILPSKSSKARQMRLYLLMIM